MIKARNQFAGVAGGLGFLLVLSTLATVCDAKVIGKNPGKIKGRWLEVKDPSTLAGYQGVYLGEVVADIQWKKERNDAPMEEELLVENLRDQLQEKLRASGALGEVLTSAPEEGASGYVRLDCSIEVEPGSRAARWAVGMGGGKSKSILEIHMRDHQTDVDLGLYHGYGVGSGVGFKLAGGGARKMTQDDNQENAKIFVELLSEIRSGL